MSKPIPPYNPDTIQPSGRQQHSQSTEILKLKRQLERVQLPPLLPWQDENRVSVFSTKAVRGWGND
jgi:hypothetical protein